MVGKTRRYFGRVRYAPVIVMMARVLLHTKFARQRETMHQEMDKEICRRDNRVDIPLWMLLVRLSAIADWLRS